MWPICVFICLCVCFIYHLDTDNSEVIPRGKWGWGKVEVGKGGINENRKRLCLGDECTMQCDAYVLLICPLETCTVL